MSEAASDERIARLESKLDRIEQLLQQGGSRNEERAEDILARLPEADRQLLQRHRFRTEYGPVLDEWFQEKLAEMDEHEKADRAANDKAGDDLPDDDETDDDDETEEKPAAKAKTAAKPAKPRTPPGRHPKPNTPPDASDDKPEPWWRRD